MEDLSPELAGLKEEIEADAGVSEEVKETIPTTDGDASKVVAGAMTKAKAVMESLEQREDGLTDESEISLEEMKESVSTDSSDSSEPAGESIDYASVPMEPEPQVPMEPMEPKAPYSAEEVMMAQEAYGLSSKVAQMVPAEYETWLFPAIGHPGYHMGQLCLARVVANLASAGYNATSLDIDPVVYARKIQIAAATWSQTHYAGKDLESTRQDLTLAPASEIVSLVPATDVAVSDLVSSQFPPLSPEEPEMVISSPPSRLPGMVAVGISGLVSLAIPVYLMRRWTKV